MIVAIFNSTLKVDIFNFNSNLKVDEEDVNKLLETDPVPVEQPSSEERTDLEDVFRWEEEYILHASCEQEEYCFMLLVKKKM